MDSSSEEEELHDIDWGQPDGSIFDYVDPCLLSPVIAAVLCDDVSNLDCHLKSGKSFNITDNQGYTPLHYAIQKNKRNAFDYLLQVPSIRIDAADFTGMTPLYYALLCEDQYYARELLKYGADINVLIHGETMLYYFCATSYNTSLDLIHTLLCYGADPIIPNVDGELPLDAAIYTCPLDIQEILLNFTYDEKDAIRLRTIEAAIDKSSCLFYELMERASRIVYSENDLKRFGENIQKLPEQEMLWIFLKKFNNVARAVFEVTKTLLSEPCQNLSFIYRLCETPHISSCVQHLKPPQHLSFKFFTLPEDDCIKVICCLLSYGAEVCSTYLDLVYKECGFCELFKIMLHMDLHECEFQKPEHFMSRLIYDVNFKLEVLHGVEESKMPEYCSLQLAKFFNLARFRSDFPNLWKKLKYDELVQVPSLLELSRNLARSYIISNLKVKNNVHFFTAIRALPVCDIYKKIITMEKEIYS